MVLHAKAQREWAGYVCTCHVTHPTRGGSLIKICVIFDVGWTFRPFLAEIWTCNFFIIFVTNPSFFLFVYFFDSVTFFFPFSSNLTSSLLIFFSIFQVAVKTIKKTKIQSSPDERRVQREITIAKLLNHNNIITVHDGKLKYSKKKIKSKQYNRKPPLFSVKNTVDK